MTRQHSTEVGNRRHTSKLQGAYSCRRADSAAHQFDVGRFLMHPEAKSCSDSVECVLSISHIPPATRGVSAAAGPSGMASIAACSSALVSTSVTVVAIPKVGCDNNTAALSNALTNALVNDTPWRWRSPFRWRFRWGRGCPRVACAGGGASEAAPPRPACVSPHSGAIF